MVKSMVKSKSKKSAGSKPKKRTTPSETLAVHLAHPDGEHHIVGIGNIRVILIPDGNRWFAQGLEIDYAAQGNSVSEAKKQFEDGLTATIEEHLRVYGNIDKVLRVAPNEAWQILYDNGAVRNR